MMNSDTVHLLNQLNQEFYQTIASDFDETRATPWDGWRQLLPYIKKMPSFPKYHVLDLGCGNGRFGSFLSQHTSIQYSGVDNNPFLLQRAHLMLHGIPHHLENADIVSGYIPREQFDLIALFGVLHHIPGSETRRQLIHQCSQWLTLQGMLVFSIWEFYKQDRFRKRIIPWESAPVPYQGLDLEKNDYLLDWQRGVSALRYCHYIDGEELKQLTEGLKVITVFEADGSNRYVLAELG